MQNSNKKQIIIFAHQGLGDCIMMIPALNKFIKQENEYIIYCKGKYESTVFELLHLANIKFEFRHKKVGSIYDAFKLIWFSVKARFIGIDEIYAPMLPGNIFYFIILKIINASKTYVTNEKFFNSFDVTLPAYWNYQGHYVKYFNEFFKISNNDTTPIYKTIKLNELISSDNDNIIGIGPGSGITELNKIPNLEWYVSLVLELKEKIKNVKFLFYGGGKYDSKLVEVLGNIYPNDSKCILNETLEELIMQLSKCKVVITGTTGPGHISSLTSVPLIILANSTNVFESAPYSDKITFITNYSNFKCAPCYRRNFNNGCGELKCLNTLSRENVIKRVNELLNNINSSRNDYNLNHLVKTKNKINLEFQHS
jgi:ADP-heptose:LPS heptosyltransferase